MNATVMHFNLRCTCCSSRVLWVLNNPLLASLTMSPPTVGAMEISAARVRQSRGSRSAFRWSQVGASGVGHECRSIVVTVAGAVGVGRISAHQHRRDAVI
jgi:hypothetical protein